MNPDYGIISIRTNKILKNRILNLDNPGKELNVNKIHRENNFLRRKYAVRWHIGQIFFNKLTEKIPLPPICKDEIFYF